MLTRQQVADWAIARGWKPDKYGNLQREGNGMSQGTYRIKFSAISIRFEKKIQLLDKWEWLRLSSGYYRDLSITPEGKLAGLKA